MIAFATFAQPVCPKKESYLNLASALSAEFL